MALPNAQAAPRQKVKVKAQKKCTKCGTVKPSSEFGTNSTTEDGLQTYCNPCKNGLQKTKRQKDINYRLKHHTLTRVHRQLAIAPADINSNLEHYLGYPIWKLKKALVADLKEREGIGIHEAFRRGYHVDHIKPLSSFDVNDLNDPADLAEFRACWHYDNLKLISAQQNLAKGTKAVEDLDFDYGL